MKKYVLKILLIVSIATLLALSGCVERRLTINTNPQGAVVTLNDEEVGVSPVTVSFNWYGDYNVTAAKQGYETLKTHRKLKAPLRDYFPFDFFAQVLSSEQIIDSYEWTFDLQPHQPIDREQLIQSAEQLRARAQQPPDIETR
jgi:hypothetical protein